MTGKNWLAYGQNAYRASRTSPWFTSYYTFVASEPMFNVSLWIADIDSMRDDRLRLSYYQDSIWSDAGGVTPTATRYPGSTIGGSGTVSDPWLSQLGKAWGSGPEGRAGLLRLDWPSLAPGQTISLRYSSPVYTGYETGNYQFVFFSPIRFSQVKCV